MKTKILLIILSIFFVLSKTESQITPYVPVEFKNLNPVWMHVSIDSTLIDGDKYDGMTHISFINDNPLPYFIHNNYIYIASNTRIKTINKNEGGLIEKLDLNSGKILWTNHFDLRNNDRYEYIESIYLNNNGNIEVVTDREVKKPEDDHAGHITYGDTAHVCIRNYDINTGDLISLRYPDSTDEESVEIRYSFINRTILYPLKNNMFQYVFSPTANVYEQYLMDEKGHLLGDPMVDTIIYERDYNPDSVLYNSINKMLKVSEDTLICLDLLYNRNDYYHNVLNPDFDKQTKLTFYDKNLQIKKTMKIDSLLPNRYDFLRLLFANKNHIGLLGRVKHHYLQRDSFFYSIFNWDGELEKHFLSIYENEFLSLTMTYLEKENEYLGVGISDDNRSLRFFKTNPDGGLDFIKDIYFKNNGRVLVPDYLIQLDNGDIILRGTNQLKKDDLRHLFWYTWMRIKAEDLGLQGTSTRDLTGQYNKLSLSPNPASDLLEIQSDNIKINKITVYDMLGRLVMDKNVPNENTYTVNVASLLPGIYSVKAIGKEKYAESAIFVKE